MRKHWLYIVVSLFLVSCEKEKSFENGATLNPGEPPLGNNCTVNQVLSVDSLTGQGLFSFYTRFNSSGVAERVEAFDSVAGTLEFESALQYKGDTIRISPTDFFLVDGNKRVKELKSVFDLGTSVDTFTYRYNYDANGYLVSKEIFSTAVPIPISIPFIRFTYTWSAGNLVYIDGSFAVPGLSQKVLTATLEYDANATAKNFIQILPDGFETYPYILALDLGKKSRNLVKKITVVTYDDTGNLDETLVSNFSNYVFSSDGYLLEWYAEGESAGGSPIPSGRTLFKYFCK
jgi:hypothetical protein